MSEGAKRIAAERQRQIEQEGFCPLHDDSHGDEALAWAAACYAAPLPIYAAVYRERPGVAQPLADPWPWDRKWDKRPVRPVPPAERVRALEKAGALIAAEIDRLLRNYDV